MDLLCPGDPTVWDRDGRRFAPCFADLVLGLGGNVLAAVAVVVALFVARRRNAPRTTENVRRRLPEKLFVFGIPSFAACIALLGLIVLVKKKAEGIDVPNHESLFRGSQFLAWVSVSLVSANGPWFEILYNPIICICWMLKILLEIPHLQYTLTVIKAMSYFTEVVSLSTSIIYGLFLIVATAASRLCNKRELNSIEAPLIPNNENSEAESTNLVYKHRNIWELLTFKSVNSMMDIGITRQLDFADLLELPSELRTASCYDKLLSSWTSEHQNHHADSSLLRAMFYAYGWIYLRLAILKVINDSISFVSPLLLNKFIRLIQQGSVGMDGYTIAISLGLTSIIKSFLDTQYSFRLAKLKLMLRSSIMGIVYRKCLCLSLSERSRFSEGEIQTFMSVDVDRTINLCNSLHDAWSLPLQIGLALYLLYTQVHYAFLSGLAITIILIPVNKSISTRIATATEKMMKQKDERVSCAGELLANIRTVKMYSWEKLFTQRLKKRRELEVTHLATRKYLDAWCVYFWATTPTLFSLFTFSIFAIMGHSLDAATVFTCVALFNTLISPLNSFPWVINGMIDAVISSRRLGNYLSTPEHCSSSLTASADIVKDGFERNTEKNYDPTAVTVRNICCSWSSSSTVQPSIILRDISLQLPKGLLIAIVGEVGSGKSSLLNSIIGEMSVISGSVNSCGSIAYVPQVPWILSGSLRDNILLGKGFDTRRYEEVIQACTLDVDISGMVGGDMSHIGEKGLNLSGGQRARLALARALYHDSDIYLFDDILSAVDSQVASWILEKSIMGPQMKQKTRLLSTHNLHAISAADMIVVMANGYVKWFGTSECFLATPYSRISEPDISRAVSATISQKDKGPSTTSEFMTKDVLDNDSVVDQEEQTDQTEAEARKEGMVELIVYKKYATFAGWSMVFIIFLSAFLMQASRNGNDLWLTYWVDTSTGTKNTRFYLVWDRDGRRFAPCFADLVLGLGGNVLAAVAVVVALFVARRRNAPRTTENVRRRLPEKLFVFGIPSFAACIALLGLIVLVKKKAEGIDVPNHESLFRGSQFLAWVSVSLVSANGPWFEILYNPIICICWMLKILLEIPHLQYTLTVIKAMSYFTEVVSLSTSIIYGLFLIVATAASRLCNKRELNSIEAPLIPNNENSEAESTNLVYKHRNIWELLTFKSVNSMMDIGITRQLDFADLLELPSELRTASCYDKLLSSWTSEHQNHHADSSLLRAMFYAYGWIYLRLAILKVINDSISFVSPLLLNKFIRLIQQGSVGMDGYTIAISLGLTSIIKSFLDTQYSFRLAKLKLMLRSSIMGIVYRKCLCLSLSERSRFSEGEIQTFMSVDVDRTINLCNSLHDAWSLPLQIGLALYLLYTQVHYAFLSGLAITIILIPVNKSISTRIATATEKMMKQKDERVSCAGELLANIRTVKMYSWEKLFTQRLKKRRELEVTHLATRKYLDAWCVYFWATTPTLFSLFTFSIFAIMGHSLDAATVFTCVALFNTLISPLNSFPWVINGMIDAVISSRRLGNYLSTPEHCSSSLTASADIVKDGFERNTEKNYDPTAVTVRNICCSWSSSSTVQPSIILRDISLQLPKGLLIAIVGEVGSGKSSLLNSIIGEMSVISGSVNSCGSIAYVPQVPWILSGSLRDNILLGKGFDTRRYEEVIQACTLDVDISGMVGGDMSHIGEKGLNLSGGQRARLALARALYHDSDIYLFDDILSAVDSQVASWILEKSIMGPQMKQKTRLLSTHNLHAISAADMIVVMANGYVKWFGTSECFLATPYSRISEPDISRAVSATISQKDKGPSTTSEFMTKDVLDNDSVVDQEEQTDQTEAEARKEGMVELIVYKKYATFAGWSMVFIIFLSAFLMQASRNGNDLWLTYWVDTSTGTKNTRFYLTILAVFGIINSFFTLGRAFSFAYGGLCAAIQIHADLLSNLISAPISFFDQNPSGRILNRLSSDLYAVDDSLPFILNIFVANFFSLLGTLVVLCYSQVTFLLILVPLWLIYSKVQFYYRSTSREVRRLDSVARSPIYSSFTETLDGSSTIRAFQKEGFFLERFIQHLTLYQKTSYSELMASLWLSLRLQLLAGSIILFIAIMAIVGFHSNSNVNFGTPGLVGLALSYAAPFVSLLNGFLTTFTETEKEMISIERVVEYVGIPQEELQGSESPNRSWPTEGKIEFEHVTLRYKADLPPALNDISFHVASGMQVGIIGRTGAGKSSILNALFRLAPICNGRILVDGFDVAKVAVRDLRGHFAVVPQSPFLFDGSLRENLDPFSITTDVMIWEALEKCHMKAVIESIGGLDIHVKESGGSFSVGQRQLLCLARAILKSSKVLCLDECTANIDNETAILLQNTISAECKGMTVLTIAHRISTVMKMDNILVLDQGKLVEEGNPGALMNDRCSRFSRFAKASTM